MRTCGTSLFLKKKFGLGFILEVEQNDKSDQEMNDLMVFLRGYQMNDSEQISGSYDESNKFVVKLPDPVNVL